MTHYVNPGDKPDPGGDGDLLPAPSDRGGHAPASSGSSQGHMSEWKWGSDLADLQWTVQDPGTTPGKLLFWNLQLDLKTILFMN